MATPSKRTMVMTGTAVFVVATAVVVGAALLGNASGCVDDVDPDDIYEAGPDGVEGTADDRPDLQGEDETGEDDDEACEDDD